MDGLVPRAKRGHTRLPVREEIVMGQVGTGFHGIMFMSLWAEANVQVKHMADAQFEIFKDATGQFRWRLRAPNGEPIAASEAYTTKAACEDGINSVKKNAPKAKIQDLTK